MANKIFRSTDTGAPAITNAAGVLCTLLDAVLVTGYPTQSLTTITQAAGLATATKVAHGFSTGMSPSISGANEDGYNGVKQVTVTDADHFTFAVDPATVSPATGTLLANTAAGKPALGWQLVFTGTNLRAYRPRAGSRMYLRVDHNTVVHHAWCRGFETMSDVNTGTGPYPTVAQLANGVNWQVTNNTAGTRLWYVWGNDRQLLVGIQGAVGNALGHYAHSYFGDITSYKPGDAYNSLITGKIATQTTTETGETFIELLGAVSNSFLNVTIPGHYMPRAPTQIGSSILVGKFTDLMRYSASRLGQGTPGTNCLNYPGPVDGALQIGRLWINTPTTTAGGPRGFIPGIWAVLHDGITQMPTAGVAEGDQFAGSDGLIALTLEMRRCANPSGGNGPFGHVVEL